MALLIGALDPLSCQQPVIVFVAACDEPDRSGISHSRVCVGLGIDQPQLMTPPLEAACARFGFCQCMLKVRNALWNHAVVDGTR